MLPNEDCWLCSGTGVRLPAPRVGAGDVKDGGVVCNSCHGHGHVRPNATRYPFEVENVQNFVAFLRDCGGFEID